MSLPGRANPVGVPLPSGLSGPEAIDSLSPFPGCPILATSSAKAHDASNSPRKNSSNGFNLFQKKQEPLTGETPGSVRPMPPLAHVMFTRRSAR